MKNCLVIYFLSFLLISCGQKGATKNESVLSSDLTMTYQTMGDPLTIIAGTTNNNSNIFTSENYQDLSSYQIESISVFSEKVKVVQTSTGKDIEDENKPNDGMTLKKRNPSYSWEWKYHDLGFLMIYMLPTTL